MLNALQAGNRSGTGQYTRQLARRLSRDAADIEVAVVWPEELEPPTLKMGDTLIPKRFAGARERIQFEQWGLRKLLRDEGADFVHFPANVGLVLPVVPNVLTVHDLSFFRDPSWFKTDRALYYRFFVGRSVKTARRVIADSEATANDLRTLLGVPAERVDVVPLGVDASFKPASDEAQAEIRQRYNLPERFFLYVGTLEPRKNIERLIKAWSRIQTQIDVDLVIAGRDGWKTGPIYRAARWSEAVERIHFPGFIADEDLPALLSAARAFTWPSLWEGFGLPVLEAMACGTPVLTSQKSSLPEVAGDAALIVDPYLVDDIARAMLRLARDDQHCAELREAGINRAAQFTWDRTTQLTLDVYRNTARRG